MLWEIVSQQEWKCCSKLENSDDIYEVKNKQTKIPKSQKTTFLKGFQK